MTILLDFEAPIAELESKLDELRHLSKNGHLNILDEVTTLSAKVEKLMHTTYTSLTPWQKVLVARHAERPHTLNYIDALITEFEPLAGDRTYGEDAALIAGLGRFNGQPVVVMGQEKGHDTETRVKHNFGMVRPEGYRKAQRLMHLAQKFNLPIISFVDTAGAYPDLDSEKRGQSEAIAKCIELSFQLEVPFISVIIGEGGSGGAIAIATANSVLMLEHSIYSVIAPESCATILWRTADKKQEAAKTP